MQAATEEDKVKRLAPGQRCYKCNDNVPHASKNAIDDPLPNCAKRNFHFICYKARFPASRHKWCEAPNSCVTPAILNDSKWVKCATSAIFCTTSDKKTPKISALSYGKKAVTNLADEPNMSADGSCAIPRKSEVEDPLGTTQFSNPMPMRMLQTWLQ